MTPRSRVERALILGLMPLRAIEYTTMDTLLTPEPVVKKLMTKSSTERVKAMSQELRIAALSWGRMMRVRQRKGLAPRSRAASIWESARALICGRMVTTT